MIYPAQSPLLDKYPFNQLEYALLGFVGNIQLKLQNIVPTMPVFILQTGDDTYMFRKKFEHIQTKEIVQHVPRVVLKIEDFQIQQEQNSMQYNELRYHYKNENWVCQGRRQNMMFTITTYFVSSNFVRALQMIEIAQSITSHDNTFTYEYVGVTWEGAYSSVGNSKEEPSMQPSSESRNYTIAFNIELNIPIWAIRAETIRSFGEAGIGDEWFPNFDIDINNGDGTFDHSDLDMTEEDFEGGTTKPEDNNGIEGGVVNGSPNASVEDTSWLPKINLDIAPKEMNNDIGKLSHKLPDKMPKEMPGGSDVPDIAIPDEMPKEMPGKQPDITIE